MHCRKHHGDTERETQQWQKYRDQGEKKKNNENKSKRLIFHVSSDLFHFYGLSRDRMGWHTLELSHSLRDRGTVFGRVHTNTHSGTKMASVAQG